MGNLNDHFARDELLFDDLSLKTLKVVRSFIVEPGKPIYCYSVASECDITRPGARVILWRLERQGWIKNAGLTVSTISNHARHMYHVTELGIREGRAALSLLQLPSTLCLSLNAL